MATEETKLQVSEEAARAFQQATPEVQLRLETLVSLQLLDMLQPRRSLDEVIAEMSRQAQARGLTPETLDELLREDASSNMHCYWGCRPSYTLAIPRHPHFEASGLPS